ncbi:hypothetical protein BD779DRAFT_1791481 [Infundibulicybe gibba]|nr:hypothetical protein BD779DRAFT_1791481 [Infundibulicybe gibba]
MVMIIGLLIPFAQMYEMASRHTEEPLIEVRDPTQQCIAFDICLDIAKKAGVRWVPVDYPAGSKRGCIILPLYERDDGHPLRMKAWAASKGVAKTRDWLKGHGMSATEHLPFVATKDPFYWSFEYFLEDAHGWKPGLVARRSMSERNKLETVVGSTRGTLRGWTYCLLGMVVDIGDAPEPAAMHSPDVEVLLNIELALLDSGLVSQNVIPVFPPTRRECQSDVVTQPVV